ncbi:galectin-12 [Rhinophrynus dorsalis]
MDPLSLLLQPPIHHPVVPYVCTIFGGLRPGRMILIQGNISSTASRFQIDLQCGCSTRPRADVAFHFNPRFSSSETHVICNTLHRDHWLDEIRYPGAPLRKGESFLLLFLFLVDRVKVSIGGKHFLDFINRVPPCELDTLGVYGDITVKEISFLCSNANEHPGEYPQHTGEGELHCTLRYRKRLLAYAYRCRYGKMPATPYSKHLPMGLSDGHLITVRGLATADPDEINLLLKSKDFIPFKLTANFQDQSLFYNHLMGPSWGEPQEIQTPFFLFHSERFFEILILAETGTFKFAVNGTPLSEFSPPSLDLKSIDEIQINGSVQLYTFRC